MSVGSAEKTVPMVWQRERVRGRVLEVGDRDVGALDQVAHRAGVAGPLRVRACPSRTPEQYLQRPVISAVPPSNGKSAPLPLTGASGRRRGRAGCRRRRTGSRSPPDRRPSSAAPSRGELGVQRPVRERLDPVDAEQRRSPQASARTSGPTASARRNASRLRCLARSVREGRRVRGQDEPRRVGRRARHRARPGSRRPRRRRARAPRSACSSRPARPRPRFASVAVARRPELGDRHDRDVGERPGVAGVAASLGSASGCRRRPATAARGRGVGVAVGRDGPAMAIDAAPRRPTWPAASLPKPSSPPRDRERRSPMASRPDDDEDRTRIGVTAGRSPSRSPDRRNAPSGRADGA